MKTEIFFLVLFPLICCFSVYENCTFISPVSSDYNPERLYPFPQNESYYLSIELDSSTEAKCLDGTNYIFNYSQGSGSGRNKFLFHFSSGAFCGIDGLGIPEECYQRSLTSLGSSSFYYKNNTNFTLKGAYAQGYYSNIEKYNSKFWNWNKIVLNYCDGASHTGYLKDPVMYNGTALWFRGNNNTFGVFEYARKYLRLFEAEEIILSGESSGGQTLKDYFPKRIKTYGIIDAGFFLDTYNTYAGCNYFGYISKNINDFVRTNNTDLFKNCKFYKTDDYWKCSLPQYIIDDIDIPMFIINSQNDFQALLTHLHIKCIANGSDYCQPMDIELILNLRQYFLNVLLKVKENHPKWGFWLRSCIDHYYWNTWIWYSNHQKVFNAEIGESSSLKEALYNWYDGLNDDFKQFNSFIDLVSFEKYCPGKW